MTDLRFITALALAAATLGGGLAQAQTTPAISRIPLATKPPAKALDLTAPGLPVLYSRAPVALPTGVARTSIEGRAPGGGVLSSGVLCGLKPNADDSGAARAYGYDPDGKFVGAKLAFSF